ncbi:MAG TPA: hypothetical protein VJB82_03995 [Candidatus Peribacterales bacterium]|nr:hypothetical protein [Candidatus Peribacterales bacterium]
MHERIRPIGNNCDAYIDTTYTQGLRYLKQRYGNSAIRSGSDRYLFGEAQEGNLGIRGQSFACHDYPVLRGDVVLEDFGRIDQFTFFWKQPIFIPDVRGGRLRSRAEIRTLLLLRRGDENPRDEVMGRVVGIDPDNVMHASKQNRRKMLEYLLQMEE